MNDSRTADRESGTARAARLPAGEAGLAHYRRVRARTEALVAPLDPEDVGLQAEEDASPPKWHLAHVTWFFETFVLQPFAPGHQPYDPRWAYLFNSYYEAAGDRHPRARRGDLSRPLLREVLAWRAHVDEAMARLLEAPPEGAADAIRARTLLGLHHEEQHQELLVMDVKVHFGAQPLRPAYRSDDPAPTPRADDAPRALDVPGGVVSVGHGGDGFAFDNEGPRHEVLLRPFRLADRLVTNADWRAFVDDGGYRAARWWLSEGWAWVQSQGIAAPRYWVPDGEGGWGEFTVRGLGALDPLAPVVHVSGYEAEAFAAWAGQRLPTEFEWEHAVAHLTADGQRGPDGAFLDDGRWHPAPAAPGTGLRQALGDVWCWTRSAYLPYPGFRPLPGALGEYNGKFMSGQWVLRGGSCATPRDHARPTYRNFFYPHQRWAFTGLRLAQDLP